MNTNQTEKQAMERLMACLPEGHLTGLYHTGEDAWTAQLCDVSEAQYNGYLETLAQNGYTVYDEKKRPQSRFTTLVDPEGFVLNTAYLPAFYSMSATLDGPERGTALYGWQSEGDRNWKSCCDTVLTQVGLCYDLAEGISPFDLEGRPGPDFTGGQFNTLRLKDGSFLVIDGGHWRDSNGDLIYHILRKQAPNPDRIVIAAWIFTHAHADHVCGFINFAPRYGSKVTVERFIYNMPIMGTPQIAETHNAMRTYFPDAERIIAHGGQTYRLRNAELEVYCTHELILPHSYAWFNETSVMFSVTVEGRKLMFLADIGPTENSYCRKMYEAAEMKSDFVQMAHHGWNGGHYKLNEMVAPDYVLFNGTTAPMDAAWNQYFFKKVTRSSGEVVFEKQDYIKEIYRAIEGVDEFTLREGEEPQIRIYKTHKEFLEA